jgi:hypothetical protein
VSGTGYSVAQRRRTTAADRERGQASGQPTVPHEHSTDRMRNRSRS